MKSKTQRVDDQLDQRSSKTVNSACRCALKNELNNQVVRIAQVENDICEKNVGSKQTHNSESISQSEGKH